MPISRYHDELNTQQEKKTRRQSTGVNLINKFITQLGALVIFRVLQDEKSIFHSVNDCNKLIARLSRCGQCEKLVDFGHTRQLFNVHLVSSQRSYL